MHIIANSINPQTKAHAMNIVTGSVGLSTIFEYIPGVLGSIATIAAIVASIVLTRKSLKSLKMDSELHKLKIERITQEIERNKLIK